MGKDTPEAEREISHGPDRKALREGQTQARKGKEKIEEITEVQVGTDKKKELMDQEKG